MAGDMSARIEKRDFIIKNIDNIEERHILDFSVNNHDRDLINILLETGSGIINGRIKLCNNNFTYMLVKGKAEVDYLIVPHRCMQLCDNFKVHLASHAYE